MNDMYNIKTLNKISTIGLAKLDNTKYNIGDDVENPDGILVRSAKMHDMQFNKELLCIARAGAGTNNIPLDRCSEEGIVVFNTPGANADAVKELALCALLLSSRDIIGGAQWINSIADKGSEIGALVEKNKSTFVGPEIKGKTLGVIGLGAIGAKIANDALSLGMEVYGYDPYLTVDSAWSLSSKIKRATDVNTIYEHSDYITIHIPYLESTKNFINADAIGLMKDGVRVINLARGELVDADAIVAAVNTGKVARYVTDFPNEKVVGVKNIIALPHLGASTPESEDNCAIMAAREMRDYLENGNINNSVNFGKAAISHSCDPRLCVFHKNIPDMIAQVTRSVSSRGINIENMVNATKKGSGIAYTMLELTTEPDKALVDTIAAIDGVIRVRTISNL